MINVVIPASISVRILDPLCEIPKNLPKKPSLFSFSGTGQKTAPYSFRFLPDHLSLSYESGAAS